MYDNPELPLEYVRRLTPLKPHPVQQEIMDDTFNINYRYTLTYAGRRCLAEGTRVYLVNGSVKLIQDVVAGDEVWSTNEEGVLEAKRVSHVYDNGIKPCLQISTNKRRIECTGNHPFLVNGHWVEADDLVLKDLMAVPRYFPAEGGDLVWEEITSIKNVGKKQTYDLTVEDNHNFIANGIVTHNSGKTELVGKRRFVARAVKGVPFPNPRYFVAAPTRDQVWRLYWQDLKVLTLPFRDPNKPPKESKLIIYLRGNREIHLLGMDKPERIEGSYWDGGVMDEYANMKPNTWEAHVGPALSTPGRGKAWCDFVGVPEGRNHYYRLVQYAKAQRIELGVNSEWNTYHWESADILSPEEIAQRKAQMDELTFAQEFCGSFINFSGRAYYNFNSDIHCAKLQYNPENDLIFCFDFNVDPGVAVIVQEQNLVDVKTQLPLVGTESTGIIGEVYIPKNSNTELVCKKIVQDWGEHQGNVFVYGDPAGGHRVTSGVKGSDWDLVKEVLLPVFGDRLFFRVDRKQPSARSRVNAVNSRLKNTLGEIRCQVDPTKASHVVTDLEGVTLLEGGSGEIDKKTDLTLTHLSDALAYYLEKEYPVRVREKATQKLKGF